MKSIEDQVEDTYKYDPFTMAVKKNDELLCRTMVVRIANAMEHKLKVAREKDRSGWAGADPLLLHAMLNKAVLENDWVSVANYAGMLYVMEVTAIKKNCPAPEDITETLGAEQAAKDMSSAADWNVGVNYSDGQTRLNLHNPKTGNSCGLQCRTSNASGETIQSATLKNFAHHYNALKEIR